MSENDDGAEKSHEATPKRREDARREGDVAQSRELNAAAAWIALWLALLGGAGAAATTCMGRLATYLQSPDRLASAAFGPHGGRVVLAEAAGAAASWSMFMLAPMAAVAVSLAAQQAVAFSGKKLKPKLERLSPVANAKQKFGSQGLVEFARSAAKLAAVVAAFASLVAGRFESYVNLASLPAEAVGTIMLREAALFLGLIALFAAALAAVDVPLSRAQHEKKLRMSFEELKRETKEGEGDPHVKHQRRERGRAIATNRMLADVPKANVVIVNPTHFAVALRWKREDGGAPILVAKGVDEMALQIRARAAAAGVPIRSDPPTARAIHASVKVGREVRREHYAAVAAAIRFAEIMRERARAR